MYNPAHDYPNKLQVKAYIGNDIPDGPAEELTFLNAEAACSTSGSIKRPIRIRRNLKRAIIIRRFSS